MESVEGGKIGYKKKIEDVKINGRKMNRKGGGWVMIEKKELMVRNYEKGKNGKEKLEDE